MKLHDNRAWLLLLPATALLGFVGLIPLLSVLNFSFHDIFSLDLIHWVGLDWYHEIIASPRFHASLGRSLLFSALTLGIQLPLGIAIALLLSRTGRSGMVMLLLIATPLVVPWNMIPVMWLSLIDPKTGLVGQALVWLGLGFDYKFTALHTWILLLAMDTWHWLGLVVILAYAALSGIPQPYYQAAAIDGASRLAVFRHIELPRITGALSIVLLLRFVDSLMIYTEAFAINAGGPNGATTFLSLDLGEAIKGFSYGSAAARSILYFVIVITVVWAFVTITEHRKRHAAYR
ncbi:sugar ABC transporter permease [Tabrizicola sp.]|uniref:carbohydrate ABC transporter permease n=1 Tax=Tabrizicola sp. TaxID=2005166 RepID=UPI00286C0E87|nr:sugar ABC transporter permease [Tabrizicola sp.]